MASRAMAVVLLALTVAGLAEPAWTAQQQVQQPAQAQAQQVDERQLERLMFDLVNKERERQGLKALAWDEALAGVARAHSRDMAAQGYVAHENKAGQKPSDRAKAQGYTCARTMGMATRFGVGENIFQGNVNKSVTVIIQNGQRSERPNPNTPEEIARQAVEGWMGSPGHRRNILDPVYASAAIGVAVARDGKVYATQNFC